MSVIPLIAIQVTREHANSYKEIPRVTQATFFGLLFTGFCLLVSCFEARIWRRIADRKMVHHLSLFGVQVEIAVHLIIEESANPGCP